MHGIGELKSQKLLKMRKLIVLSIVLIPYLIQAQSISLDIKAPEQVYSGSDFMVNVHITKGNKEGFGRLLVKIPSGFTPVEKKSAHGKFEFDGSQIKIIWLEMPNDQRFTVSFALKAAPNMEGYKVIRGEMSLATGDGSYRAEPRPHIITVQKTDNIATADSVVFEYSYIKELGVSAIRQKPYLNDSSQAVINILVNKGDLAGFGKIEESIPPGYTALSLVSNSAIFVFNKSNRKVKFLWYNMPRADHFIVSYILSPIKGRLENIPFIITGEFMYTEGSTTKTSEILERNIDLEKMLE